MLNWETKQKQETAKWIFLFLLASIVSLACILGIGWVLFVFIWSVDLYFLVPVPCYYSPNNLPFHDICLFVVQ